MMNIDKELRWTGPEPSVVNETEPFWKACNNNIFLIQQCSDCNEVQYHYRAFCCHCWSDNIKDLPISGEGKVWTYSVVKVNRSPQFAEWGEYATGVVEIPEGVKIISRILADDLEKVLIGAPVRLTFAQSDAGQKIPVFAVMEQPEDDH